MIKNSLFFSSKFIMSTPSNEILDNSKEIFEPYYHHFLANFSSLRSLENILNYLYQIENKIKLDDFIDYLIKKNFKFNSNFKHLGPYYQIDKEDFQYILKLKPLGFSFQNYDLSYLISMSYYLSNDFKVVKPPSSKIYKIATNQILEYFIFEEMIDFDFRKLKKKDLLNFFVYCSFVNFKYLLNFYQIDIHQLFYEHTLFYYVKNKEILKYFYEEGVDLRIEINYYQDARHLKKLNAIQRNEIRSSSKFSQFLNIISTLFDKDFDLYQIDDLYIYQLVQLVPEKNIDKHQLIIQRLLSIDKLNSDYFTTILNVYLNYHIDIYQIILEKYFLTANFTQNVLMNHILNLNYLNHSFLKDNHYQNLISQIDILAEIFDLNLKYGEFNFLEDFQVNFMDKYSQQNFKSSRLKSLINLKMVNFMRLMYEKENVYYEDYIGQFLKIIEKYKFQHIDKLGVKQEINLNLC